MKSPLMWLLFVGLLWVGTVSYFVAKDPRRRELSPQQMVEKLEYVQDKRGNCFAIFNETLISINCRKSPFDRKDECGWTYTTQTLGHSLW